jgi:anaerobic selenocysteine-containing dehydrogenase
MACIEAARRGEMQAAFCLGGNLYGSNPDARFAHEAIARIGTIVYLSTTLNTGHAWGTGATTLILPVLPRDEEPQPTTQESMFSFVRLSSGGRPRHLGPRSEVSVLAKIGQELLARTGASPVDWSRLESHAAIRALIAELIPEYEALKEIDASRREFHVPGRAVRRHRFPTPTGRATFHPVPLRASSAPPEGGNEFRLMTIRSEGQFNSVVYDEEDLYRGQERRDVVLMHPDDMQRLHIDVNRRVRLRSAAGEMRSLLARPFPIRPGNVAAYYPEANAIVPHAVDPLSRTPGFKSVRVTVEPETDV